MLNESWKKKLVRYAHTGKVNPSPRKGQPMSPKLVLGHQCNLRKVMNPQSHWLNEIQGDIRQDDLLSQFTSIRIGGPADLIIFPKGIEDIQCVLKNRGKIPLLVLGEGTNMLVRDSGFRGIVLCLKDGFKSIEPPRFYRTLEGTERAVIQAEAGVKMSYLVKYAARYSLGGLEGLVGVPGSLGGAIWMNAGAEGTEIGPFVRSVTRVRNDGEIETLKKDQLAFEYRKSIFPPGGGLIVEAEIDLEKKEHVEIFETLNRNIEKRGNTQPLNLPNSGSVFRNPPGDTSGRLIESVGLKGASRGKASVSIKHANFIVNQGGATAEDVLELIEHVRQTVKEKTGVELETEIVIAKE